MCTFLKSLPFAWQIRMVLAAMLAMATLALAPPASAEEMVPPDSSKLLAEVVKCGDDAACIAARLQVYHVKLIDFAKHGLRTEEDAKRCYVASKSLKEVLVLAKSKRAELMAINEFADSARVFSYYYTVELLDLYGYFVSQSERRHAEYGKSPEWASVCPRPESLEAIRFALGSIDSAETARAFYAFELRSRERDRVRELGLTYTLDGLLALLENSSVYREQVEALTWLLDTFVANKRLQKADSKATEAAKAKAQAVLDYLASHPEELAGIVAEGEAILADMKDNPSAEPATRQADMQRLQEVVASLRVILKVMGIREPVPAAKSVVPPTVSANNEPEIEDRWPYMRGGFPAGYPRPLNDEERRAAEELLRTMLGLLREEKYQELVDDWLLRMKKDERFHKGTRENVVRALPGGRDVWIGLIENLLEHREGWIQVDRANSVLLHFYPDFDSSKSQACSITLFRSSDQGFLGFNPPNWIPPSVAAWWNLRNPARDHADYVQPVNKDLVPYIKEMLRNRMQMEK
jgi:hypothetical protein